jgi:hypothetical protein
VPDEEAGSAGARAAAAVLPALADELGLSLAAAVNLDAMADEGDGAEGRRVALGTVGKLLPSALVVGRAVHAADALRGVNAGALAGRIAAAVECSGALAERTGEEAAAPPTLLGLKDGRSAYDVTTPERTWLYWNVMTHRRDPAEVLATLAGLCREVADDHVRRLTKRARILGAERPVPRASRHRCPSSPSRTSAARRSTGTRRPGAIRDLSPRGRRPRPGPARAVPACSPSTPGPRAAGRAGRGARVRLCPLPADDAGRAERRPPRGGGAARGRRRRRSPRDDHRDLPILPRHLRHELPGAGRPVRGPDDRRQHPRLGLRPGLAADGGIAGLPIVNAGPWGRDYHTPLERVHAGYAFEVLPDLVPDPGEGVLADESGE